MDGGYYCPQRSTAQLRCGPGKYCGTRSCGQSDCPAGSYCPEGSSSPTTCPAGSYCTGGVATHTACSSGNYCPAGSATQRVCACGSFCGTPAKQVSCPGGKVCAEGTVTPAPCPAASFCSGGTCTPVTCPAGSYCPEGSSSPTTCPAGSFCAGGVSTHTACPGGSYCPAGSADHIPCRCGTYCPASSPSEAACPAGSYCVASASAPTACASGDYCAESSCNAVDCLCGNVCATPATQVPCPGGTVCSSRSSQTVRCPEGRFCPPASCDTSVCPAGTFCAGGNVAPVPCTAGYACPVEATSVPTPCTAGNYCPQGTISDTTACQCGSFCQTPATQVSCPPGKLCIVSTVTPAPCPETFYCGGGTCAAAPCPAGAYCPESSVAPTLCPLGSFCVASVSAPRPCDQGSYCLPGSSTQTDCPCGSYCRSPSEVQQCAAGTQCQARSDRESTCAVSFYCPPGTCAQSSCPCGSYCPTPAQSIACQSGDYCVPSQTSPGSCVAGNYCPPPYCTQLACSCGFYCAALVSVQTECSAGTYCPPSAVAPTPCGVPGDYCPARSCTQGSCPCGSFCATSATIAECPGGTYCGSRSVASTPCPAGSYCPPRSCGPISCVCGTYCTAGVSAPTPCAARYYCLAKASVQLPCPGGSYCPPTSCSPIRCTCGTFCPDLSDAPLTCPAGSYCGAQVAGPTACRLGQICNTGVCFASPCPAQYYCPTPASQLPCTVGSYCPQSTAAPIPCTLGDYCVLPMLAVNISCSVGSYCPTVGQKIACTTRHYCPLRSYVMNLCPRGGYCPNPSTFIVCPEGSYCPLGSTSPIPCTTLGTYCARGSHEVGWCPLANYCPSPSQMIICPKYQYCPRYNMTAPLWCNRHQYCPIGTWFPINTTTRTQTRTHTWNHTLSPSMSVVVSETLTNTTAATLTTTVTPPPTPSGTETRIVTLSATRAWTASYGSSTTTETYKDSHTLMLSVSGRTSTVDVSSSRTNSMSSSWSVTTTRTVTVPKATATTSTSLSESGTRGSWTNTPSVTAPVTFTISNTPSESGSGSVTGSKSGPSGSCDPSASTTDTYTHNVSLTQSTTRQSVTPSQSTNVSISASLNTSGSTSTSVTVTSTTTISGNTTKSESLSSSCPDYTKPSFRPITSVNISNTTQPEVVLPVSAFEDSVTAYPIGEIAYRTFRRFDHFLFNVSFLIPLVAPQNISAAPSVGITCERVTVRHVHAWDFYSMTIDLGWEEGSFLKPSVASVFIPHQLFQCMQYDIAIQLRIQDQPLPIPPHVVAAVQTTAVATASVSGMAGSVTFGQQSLLAAVYTTMLCVHTSDEPLDASSSPLQLEVEPQRGRFIRGGVVGNLLIVVGAMLLGSLACLVWGLLGAHMNRKKQHQQSSRRRGPQVLWSVLDRALPSRFVDGVAAVISHAHVASLRLGIPSVVTIFISPLMQPLAMLAVQLFVNYRHNTADVLLALFVLLVAVTWGLYVVSHTLLWRRVELLATDRDKCAWYVRIFVRSHRWVAPTAAHLKDEDGCKDVCSAPEVDAPHQQQAMLLEDGDLDINILTKEEEELELWSDVPIRCDELEVERPKVGEAEVCASDAVGRGIQVENTVASEGFSDTSAGNKSISIVGGNAYTATAPQSCNEGNEWKLAHRFLFGDCRLAWFPVVDYATSVTVGVLMGLKATKRCMEKSGVLLTVFTLLVAFHCIMLPLATVVGQFLTLAISIVTGLSVIVLLVAVLKPEYEGGLLVVFQFVNVVSLCVVALQQVVAVCALLFDVVRSSYRLWKSKREKKKALKESLREAKVAEETAAAVARCCLKEECFEEKLQPSSSQGAPKLKAFVNRLRLAMRFTSSAQKAPTTTHRGDNQFVDPFADTSRFAHATDESEELTLLQMCDLPTKVSSPPTAATLPSQRRSKARGSTFVNHRREALERSFAAMGTEITLAHHSKRSGASKVTTLPLGAADALLFDVGDAFATTHDDINMKLTAENAYERKRQLRAFEHPAFAAGSFERGDSETDGHIL